MYINTLLVKVRTSSFLLSQTPKTGIWCLSWLHVLDGNISCSCTAKTIVLREKPGHRPFLFSSLFSLKMSKFPICRRRYKQV